MRIAVIGFSGSGKSTLAGKLGARYGLPVLHMDCLHFRKNWQPRSKAAALFILEPYLKNPDWVIDGNYHKLLYQQRMELADRIILLDFPRRVCLYQAWQRYRQNKGTTRRSMAPGCPEKFDWAFVRWILWGGRSRSIRNVHKSLLQTFPRKIIICKNHRDLEVLLQKDLREPL